MVVRPKGKGPTEISGFSNIRKNKLQGPLNFVTVPSIDYILLVKTSFQSRTIEF